MLLFQCASFISPWVKNVVGPRSTLRLSHVSSFARVLLCFPRLYCCAPGKRRQLPERIWPARASRPYRRSGSYLDQRATRLGARPQVYRCSKGWTGPPASCPRAPGFGSTPIQVCQRQRLPPAYPLMSQVSLSRFEPFRHQILSSRRGARVHPLVLPARAGRAVRRYHPEQQPLEHPGLFILVSSVVYRR